MVQQDSYFPAAVHAAGFVCAVCNDIGLPMDPMRLRSWHSREGLQVGRQDGGWRRYSDYDVLAIAMVRLLADCGVPPGQTCPALTDNREARQDIEWATRIAVGARHLDSSENLFVAAVHRPGKPVFLVSGARDKILDLAAKATSVAGRPAVLFNLSELATRIRAATFARYSESIGDD